MEMPPFQQRTATSFSALRYVALTFAFSWAAWILCIEVHAPEELLLIGSAGPALVSMLLSSNGVRGPHKPISRVLALVAALGISWAVLWFHYSPAATASVHPLAFAVGLVAPAMVVAWIISAALTRDTGVRSLLTRLIHTPDRWSLYAFLLFLGVQLVPAAIVGVLHLPLVSPPHRGSTTALVGSAIMLSIYNFLFVAVLEEPGWRGFLLDHLLERHSPLIASIAVWLPWALWHWPLDCFRPAPFSLVMYLQVRVIFLLPITLIMTWFYQRSRRSVQSTAVFHASMNTFPFVLPYFQPGFALLFVFAGYAIVAGRMWRKPTLSPALGVAA